MADDILVYIFFGWFFCGTISAVVIGDDCHAHGHTLGIGCHIMAVIAYLTGPLSLIALLIDRALARGIYLKKG